MNSIETSYLGLTLKSPLIVSASSLSSTLSGIQKAADNGAGAIVIKSLFEEQINADIDHQAKSLDEYAHPEAQDYLNGMGMAIAPKDYANLVADAVRTTGTPIIASFNCTSAERWGEFSMQIQDSGASAIELNIGNSYRSLNQSSHEIESRVVRTVEAVCKKTTLPVSVKLGNDYSNLPSLANQLVNSGIKGLVLFNRYYQLDINIEKLCLKPGIVFSNPQDYYPALRWISLLFKRNNVDFAASSGIHDSSSAIKLIMAGANVVQLCSTIYKNGYGQLRTINDEIKTWLSSHNYASIREVIGLMAQNKSQEPEKYERVQYIKALTGIN